MCIFVWMYVCMYVCVFACMCVCVCLRSQLTFAGCCHPTTVSYFINVNRLLLLTIISCCCSRFLILFVLMLTLVAIGNEYIRYNHWPPPNKLSFAPLLTWCIHMDECVYVGMRALRSQCKGNTGSCNGSYFINGVFKLHRLCRFIRDTFCTHAHIHTCIHTLMCAYGDSFINYNSENNEGIHMRQHLFSTQ